MRQKTENKPLQHLTVKAILLNCETLSTMFCPRLSEIVFISFLFLTRPKPLGIYIFDKFQYVESLFHSQYSMATVFRQTTKFYIFQKALFLTLVSRANMIAEAVLVETGDYLLKVFTFFYQKLIIFGVPMHFQSSTKHKENFQSILEKTFRDFFRFCILFLHHK